MDQHAIIVADQNGVIQLWSKGAAEVTGYSHAEAVGQKLDLVVPADFRDKHWDGFGKAMQGGPLNTVGVFFDLPVHCRGGIKTLRGQLHVLRNEDGAPIGAMAILTERA